MKLRNLWKVLSAMVLCVSMGAVADEGRPISIPEGFSSMAVYVADGQFDAATPNPNIPNCQNLFCFGTHWFDQIMGMTPTQIAAEEKAARAFFLKRFGVDATALAAAGKALFAPFALDPRGNYRARMVDTSRVHDLGWEVHDGGFALVLMADTALGGEWSGTKVPAGTMMVFGGYAIQPSRLSEHHGSKVLTNRGSPMVIRYQSGEPIFPAGPSGAIFFRCEITTSPWGPGKAQGVNSMVAVGNGVMPNSIVKMSIRNVLTFSAPDGLGNYEGVYNDPNVIIRSR